MNRCVLQTLMLIGALFVGLPAYAETLPTGGQDIHGEATITSSGDTMTINQDSSRAVITWDTFNIGTGAHVDYIQPGSESATLNVVDGETSSILAGELTATGSVFLINPHGITVTPDGAINTGGAFVASTLRAVDDANFTHFMSGSDSFEFKVPGGGTAGNVLNEGAITAHDVLLLGGRVKNSGDIIVTRYGRVGMGSASHATLDLSGDGFLQVLLPATVDGDEALVTNSGTIDAEGGLVILAAATAYDAVREAVNMPGEIRARSVSGQDGAISFHGGEGGTVTVAGEVDASPLDEESSGGYVELIGATIDADLGHIDAGAGGHVKLGANTISIAMITGDTAGTTHIVETLGKSSIGDFLRAGTHLTLHANEDLVWSGGLLINEVDLFEEAKGQAGHLQLKAGRKISLSGNYMTYNSDWTLTANARPWFGPGSQDGHAEIVTFDAEFHTNRNGHLKLEIVGGDVSAGRVVSGISTPIYDYSGAAFTATISSDAIGYDEADIMLSGSIDVVHDIALSGHLRSNHYTELTATLSGQRVTWLTEKTDRLAGRFLKFVEDGVITRFGRGINAPTEPGVDAVRLELGSTAFSVNRLYGDDDLDDPLALGDHIFSVASHNSFPTDENTIPFSQILKAGSLKITGPGVGADVGHYALFLSATDDIAFNHELQNPSDDSANFWIDLTGGETGASVALEITPRPLTANILDPSYTYRSPEAAVSFDGIVNDDIITPVGSLNGTEAVWYTHNGGFGFAPNLDAGSYMFTVTGISGSKAGNYAFDTSALPEGSLSISPKPIHYDVDYDVTQTYGSLIDVSGAKLSLSGTLSGDDVQGVLGAFRAGEEVPLHQRMPAATYAVGVATLVGDDAHNFVVAPSGNTPGSLTILPKQITWSVADTTSTYGMFHLPGQATLHGVLDDDAVFGMVEVTDALGNPVTHTHPVLSYVQKVVRLTGADSANYTMASFGHETGLLTIEPAVVTYDGTAKSYSTVYGESLFHTSSMPDLKGVLPGDSVNINSRAADLADLLVVTQLTGSEKTFHSHPVGTYAVTLNPDLAALEGPDSKNYVLQHEGSLPTIVTITPLTIHYSVGSMTANYGASWTAPSVQLFGILGQDEVYVDTERIALVKDKEPQDSVDRLPVGSHVLDILGRTLDGEAAENYVLTDSGSLGNLTITRKSLTWSQGVDYNVYGDPLHISDYTLHGLLDGDDVRPIWDIGNPQPQVGTYFPWMTGVEGSDVGNYSFDGPISLDDVGRLHVTPRPLQYSIDSTTGMYGETGSYGAQFPIGDVNFYNLAYSDEEPEVYFRVYDESGTLVGEPPFGFTRYDPHAGDYTVHITRVLDPNYTIDLDYSAGVYGTTRITPRPITYSTALSFNEAAFLSLHTSSPLPSAEVTLHGLLVGDEVTAEAVAPDIDMYVAGPAAGYYRAGTYTWRVRELDGLDAGNYFVAIDGNTDGILTIRPYKLQPVIEIKATYGSWPEIEMSFVPYDREVAIDNFEEIMDALDVRIGPTNVYIGRDGNTFLADDEWDRWRVGEYVLRPVSEDTYIVGNDASNFEVPDFPGVPFQVDPMPVTAVMESGSRTYGDNPDLLDLIFVLEKLEQDDVQVRYTTPEGFTDYDPRNPVGTYTGFHATHLGGNDAINYTLVNPGLLDGSVTVLPRRVFEWPDPNLLERTFGEYLDLAPELDYVVRGDESLVWGEPMVRPMGRPDDEPRSAREVLDAGSYWYFVELAGPAADNYFLNVREWEARILPKEITYAVHDVVGQYGNYLVCEGSYYCHGTLWHPGLTTGEVHFDGLVPGHEDVTGVVGLIDFNGQVGRLADVPPPGTYFQVITELEGRDGRNYTIAPTGSSPGILNIIPQWVDWETHDALFMGETGFLVDTPEGIKTTLTATLDYRPVPHPFAGITPLEPQLYYVDFHTNAVYRRVNLSRVARYEYRVSHFEGLNADYYRPLPRERSGVGTLSVLGDSTMGFQTVGRIDTPPEIPNLIPEMPLTADESFQQWLGEVYQSNPLCDFGTCIEFGARTEHSTQTSTQVGEVGITSQAGGYADSLAEFGVSGVSLQASAGGQVNIEFEFGPGFIELSASAQAQFGARFDATGAELTAKLEAGMSAGTGVRGGLGGGAEGQLSLTAGAGASLQAGTSYGVKDGKVIVENKFMASASASAGIQGEISGEVGGVKGGATVYGPGTAGAGVGGGVGYDDGRLSFELTLSLGLGFGGFELSLGFDINLKAIPGFIEVSEFMDNAVSGAMCWAAGILCSSGEPSASAIAASNRRGLELANDPVARFRYLNENAEWMYADPDSEVFLANYRFLSSYLDMAREVDSYIQGQKDTQETLLRLMEEDPAAAIEYAQEVVHQSHAEFGTDIGRAIGVRSALERMGVQLKVVEGQAYFSSR